MKFELVLPCFNEEKSLGTLVERVERAALEYKISSTEFQLVLVENGSKDRSREVMNKLRNTSLGKWFRIVLIDQNQGYGFGIWSGLTSTTAKYVGWSHADQQCDPADAFRALTILEEWEGKDDSKSYLIKGIRQGRSFKEIIVSRTFDFMARLLLGFKAYEINAQPKIFRRDLLDLIVNPPKNFAFDIYVLFRAVKHGYVIRTFRVLFPPRVHGLSNWAASLRGRFKTIWGIILYMKDLSKSEGRL